MFTLTNKGSKASSTVKQVGPFIFCFKPVLSQSDECHSGGGAVWDL